MPANVVESERKRGEQGGDETIGIDPEGGDGAGADEADDEGGSDQSYDYRGNFLKRKLLLTAGDHAEQHPDRRGVLHDDGDGHIDALDGDVIKVIRNGDAENSQEKTISEVAGRQLDSLPSMKTGENRQEHEQRKCGAGLGKNQGIDAGSESGMQRGRTQREPTSKDGAAESSGDSPEKSGAGDKEVAAKGMRSLLRCVRDRGPRR
jgi:hypothetical protein